MHVCSVKLFRSGYCNQMEAQIQFLYHQKWHLFIRRRINLVAASIGSVRQEMHPQYQSVSRCYIHSIRASGDASIVSERQEIGSERQEMLHP